jgi:hypothetical protein
VVDVADVEEPVLLIMVKTSIEVVLLAPDQAEKR